MTLPWSSNHDKQINNLQDERDHNEQAKIETQQ